VGKYSYLVFAANSYITAFCRMAIAPFTMQGKDDELLEHLARYISDEAKDKCGNVLDTSGWPRLNPACEKGGGGVPRQHNGCDCGVFTIM
jgi:Ulp1 family protease